MNINNKILINKMKNLILNKMCKGEVLRYYNSFKGKEYDYNIYTYGCLDIYDYDLFIRLKDFGLTTKPVRECEKVLNGGCTYKHRKDIRNAYKTLVRYATQSIMKDYNRI